MNIFVLPGISPKTERWATNLLNELAGPDRTGTVQRYRHWDCEGGDQCLDLEGEVSRLENCDVDLLVAKSLGVMIGLAAAAKKLIAPRRAVLIGTPVLSFVENNMNLRHLVESFGVPLLFIQQKDDIVGSAASLKAAIDGIPMVELVEIPGDNHQYKDLKLLARHIKKFI
jgi:hypothetical protein